MPGSFVSGSRDESERKQLVPIEIEQAWNTGRGIYFLTDKAGRGKGLYAKKTGFHKVFSF
jgi:hypothetical protein